MNDLSPIGKGLIWMGLILIVLGALVLSAGKVPFLGRLPGDIHVERPGFSFYFPLTTCLLVSALASLVLWLVSRFK